MDNRGAVLDQHDERALTVEQLEAGIGDLAEQLVEIALLGHVHGELEELPNLVGIRAVPVHAREQLLGPNSQGDVVDLVGVLGYYTLISMTINAFEVPLPDGVEPELY